MDHDATRAALDQATAGLALLARYVDTLAASSRLGRHCAIRAQLRRASLEALASASNAVEEPAADRRRRESLRSLGALYELDVISRIARHAGALSNEERAAIGRMHGDITRVLRAEVATGVGDVC